MYYYHLSLTHFDFFHSATGSFNETLVVEIPEIPFPRVTVQGNFAVKQAQNTVVGGSFSLEK